MHRKWHFIAKIQAPSWSDERREIPSNSKLNLHCLQTVSLCHSTTQLESSVICLKISRAHTHFLPLKKHSSQSCLAMKLAHVHETLTNYISVSIIFIHLKQTWWKLLATVAVVAIMCVFTTVMAQNARFAPVLCANFQDGKVREDMHHYIRSFACNLNAFQYKTHFWCRRFQYFVGKALSLTLTSHTDMKMQARSI